MKQDVSIWFWENQSPEQVKGMMESLPLFRREKAQSYVFDKDRILCAKSYLMLRDVLEEKYGMSEVPDFEFGLSGKPYLKASRLFFNLSHCPKGIVCVVSDSEVGCDIEEVPQALDMDVCRLCFNRKEIDSIFEADDPNVEFTRLWTVKEAYLKLTGEGLTDSLPEVLSESVLSRVAFSTELYVGRGCVSTIASYL